MTSVRRAAVLGSPVSHSRSPNLHLAAYRALGLTDWTYERIECTAEQLPALVSGLDESYIGLSVTMPGKHAALEFADVVTNRARLAGSANTLVRTDQGWRADCTDIDGVLGALTEVGATDLSGASAVVVGAGGTAAPAIVALSEALVRGVTIAVRNPGRAAGAVAVAQSAGLDVTVIDFDDRDRLRRACADSAALVSTIPADGAALVATELAAARRVVDVIYHPWPTPLAEAVATAGGAVAGGLVMLLNQAYGQVEQFTGQPAPKAAMASALND